MPYVLDFIAMCGVVIGLLYGSYYILRMKFGHWKVTHSLDHGVFQIRLSRFGRPDRVVAELNPRSEEFDYQRSEEEFRAKELARTLNSG